MEKRTVYRGKARIVNIGLEELPEYMKMKLPERDRENAFNIVYDVETAENVPRRFDVKVELSHRELSGKALEWNRREDGATPTQVDIAIKDLVRQGLLPKGATEQDLGSAMADEHIGREVCVSVTEDPRDENGTYWPPKARFVSPFARLQGDAAANRIAAFLGRAPKPVAPPEPIPAPAEDDLPF